MIYSEVLGGTCPQKEDVFPYFTQDFMRCQNALAQGDLKVLLHQRANTGGCSQRK